MSPKIHATIWDDDDFQSLDRDQRLTFIWLFSNQNRNNIGYVEVSNSAYKRSTLNDIEVLRMTLKALARAFVWEESEGKIRVWIRHFIKHQWTLGELTPKSNIFKNLVSLTDVLPVRFKAECCHEYPTLARALKALQEAEGPPRALNAPEQNREEQNRTEHHQNPEGGPGETSVGATPKIETRNGGLEVPSDAEVIAFGDSWPGELASGTPPMPADWVAAWLSKMNGRTVGWPLDWRRAMVAAWRVDFRLGWGNGRVKKSSGVWELKSQLQALRQSAEVHPGNEQSSAWTGDLDAETRREYEELMGKIAAVEKQLGGMNL